MTEKPQKLSGIKIWFWRLAKIALIGALFLFVVFTVMTTMGGSSPVLKGAIEDFLADSTGHPASIETLNRMTFFPNISVDVENIEIRGADGTGLLVRVKKARLSSGFFDVVFGNDRVKLLDIREIAFAPGVVMEQLVRVEYFSILKEPESGQAFLGGKGTIGRDPFVFRWGAHMFGQGARQRYALGREAPFEAHLKNMTLSGMLAHKDEGGIILSDFTLEHADMPVATGTLDFLREGDTANLSGSFNFKPNNTQLKVDLGLNYGEGGKVTGTLESAAFYVDDFKDNSVFQLFFKEMLSIFNIKPFDVDITIDLERVIDGNGEEKPLSRSVEIEDWQIGTLDVEQALK